MFWPVPGVSSKGAARALCQAGAMTKRLWIHGLHGLHGLHGPERCESRLERLRFLPFLSGSLWTSLNTLSDTLGDWLESRDTHENRKRTETRDHADPQLRDIELVLGNLFVSFSVHILPVSESMDMRGSCEAVRQTWSNKHAFIMFRC